MHPITLLRVNERSQGNLATLRIADGQVVRVLGQQRRVVAGDLCVDDVAAGGHADLTLVHERTEGSDRDGLFQIHVVHHDQGRVTTEFEVDSFEVLGAEGSDDSTSGGGTGEGNYPDSRIDDERFADLDSSGQHAEDTSGNSGLFEYARQNNAAAECGARIGLQDNGVAERERRSDGTDREDEREVEGRNDADNPGGHPARETEAWLFASKDLTSGV
jgi:hypothetical protein